MFFIITPALICGAFAERMKFSTMVVFTILWGTLVYCPLAPLGVGAAASWRIGSQGGRIVRRRRAGFRGRHGRAYQLGRFGFGVRAAHRPAARLCERSHAAAQSDVHR